MDGPPWDQRIASVLVKPLVRSPVTPNQVTAATLLMALAGAGLFAPGDAGLADWGAGLFVLARFLDHFDGELARQKAMTSRLGYYLDYITGGLSYGALFICLGVSFASSPLGPWAYGLGGAGAAAALAAMFLNLEIDKQRDGEAVGYPGVAGFELEDGIYLLAPITWAGFLMPFFVAGGVGAVLYCLWTLACLLRKRP